MGEELSGGRGRGGGGVGGAGEGKGEEVVQSLVCGKAMYEANQS